MTFHAFEGVPGHMGIGLTGDMEDGRDGDRRFGRACRPGIFFDQTLETAEIDSGREIARNLQGR